MSRLASHGKSDRVLDPRLLLDRLGGGLHLLERLRRLQPDLVEDVLAVGHEYICACIGSA